MAPSFSREINMDYNEEDSQDKPWSGRKAGALNPREESG